MFKAILFVCLLAVVLAGNERGPQSPRQLQGMRGGNNLNRPQNNRNRVQNSSGRLQNNNRNQPRNRVIRQMPPMPGGMMNPGDIAQTMSDGIQKGVGTMANMMNPGKWMQAASQMIPKSDDNH